MEGRAGAGFLGMAFRGTVEDGGDWDSKGIVGAEYVCVEAGRCGRVCGCVVKDGCSEVGRLRDDEFDGMLD